MVIQYYLLERNLRYTGDALGKQLVVLTFQSKTLVISLLHPGLLMIIISGFVYNKTWYEYTKNAWNK
jgi:hypothetical protein